MIFIDHYAQVAREHAERDAVIWPDGALSHGALWRRVEVIGSALRARGIGAESRVGLSLALGPDYLIALLATWWCRAAFVPLPHELPEVRRRQLIASCALDLILHDDAPRDGLSCPQATLAALDATAPDARTRAPGAPHQLAYIFHTSGSTGRPKGVMVEQRGLVPMLRAQLAAFAMDPTSRALLYLSTAFDASVSDMGCALLSGGAAIIDTPRAAPGQALLARLRALRITHADLPPSALARMSPDDAPASLQTIIMGGEVCDPQVARAWAQKVRLVNVYGPTEATVCTSLGRVDPDAWDEPLIGAPLPHVRYSVRDESGAEAARGELWIGGDALARGYLDHEALQAARFITREGARWYRTGDLVQTRADGALVFLGRVDRQLKLRGALVAPEEIEAALRAAGARDAAVLPLTDTAGRVSLGACVTPSQLDLDAVRASLRDALPSWMLPAKLIARDALARHPSGKLDLASLREALADAAQAQPASAPAPGREPALQATITRLVSEVLGEDLHPDADLFEAGFDSFMVLELCALARGLGLEILPSWPFEARSARGLGRRLSGAQALAPTQWPDAAQASALEADIAADTLSVDGATPAASRRPGRGARAARAPRPGDGRRRRPGRAARARHPHLH